MKSLIISLLFFLGSTPGLAGPIESSIELKPKQEIPNLLSSRQKFAIWAWAGQNCSQGTSEIAQNFTMETLPLTGLLPNIREVLLHPESNQIVINSEKFELISEEYNKHGWFSMPFGPVFHIPLEVLELIEEDDGEHGMSSLEFLWKGASELLQPAYRATRTSIVEYFGEDSSCVMAFSALFGAAKKDDK